MNSAPCSAKLRVPPTRGRPLACGAALVVPLKYVENGVQTMYTDRMNRDRTAKLSKGVMPDQLVVTGC